MIRDNKKLSLKLSESAKKKIAVCATDKPKCKPGVLKDKIHISWDFDKPFSADVLD